MNASSPNILGRALFGTSRGLDFVGNGIFAFTHNTTGVFEFDIGRSPRTGSLHSLEPPANVIFRRRLAGPTEERFEMLGWLAPFKDSAGRPGFMGACVAVQPDRIKGAQPISSWKEALTDAREMFVEFQGMNQAQQNLVFPHASSLRLAATTRALQLNVPSPKVLCLYEMNEGSEEDLIDRFQAICFELGDQISTVIWSRSALESAKSIRSSQFDAAVRDFEVAKRRSMEVATMPPAASRNQSNEFVRQVAVAHRKSGTDTNNVSMEERISALEVEVNSLKQKIQTVTLKHPRKMPFSDKQDKTDNIFNKKELILIAAISILIFFAAGMTTWLIGY